MTVAKAVWNQIQLNDNKLMRRVHRWRAPRWFRILMIVSTRGGDGWLWYALGLILLFLRGAQFAARCGCISRFGRSRRDSSIPRPQALEPPQAALRDRAALAGLPSCRRTNTHISLGPFHHGIRNRNFDWALLSAAARVLAGDSVSDRRFAHHSWNALPERCAGGVRDRSDAGPGKFLYLCNVVTAARETKHLGAKKTERAKKNPSPCRFSLVLLLGCCLDVRYMDRLGGVIVGPGHFHFSPCESYRLLLVVQLIDGLRRAVIEYELRAGLSRKQECTVPKAPMLGLAPPFGARAVHDVARERGALLC